MKTLPTQKIDEFKGLKLPSKIFYKGNINLLERHKVSIVGSRRPSSYSKNLAFELAKKLSAQGVCIVSGAAMGIDAVAHKAAGSSNTIAVMGNSLDIIYPKVNRHLIKDIEENSLVLSRFEPGFRATPWSFVLRNEMVVALGEILIVAQADIDSGSIRSAEIAKKQGKDIYVFPQRIKDSEGTNMLLKNQMAKAIYSIDEFVSYITKGDIKKDIIKDEFWQFCSTFPRYEEALRLYGDRVFEAELNGEIEVQNGVVYLC